MVGIVRRKKERQAGFSLMEMLVSLTILGILASVTIPFAKVGVVRHHEYELQENLRMIRNAVDAFHRDWENEVIARSDESSSMTGYPVTLEVLVEGAPLKDSQDIKKYLRRIPKDPFAEADAPAAGHWVLRSSQDDPESTIWGGEDVFDVTVNQDREALDGSYYRDW